MSFLPDEDEDDAESKAQDFHFGNSSKHKRAKMKRNVSESAKSVNNNHSVTFSSTVSLFTESEKAHNSLLFHDLWGFTEHIQRLRNESSTSPSSNRTGTNLSPRMYAPRQPSLGALKTPQRNISDQSDGSMDRKMDFFPPRSHSPMSTEAAIVPASSLCHSYLRRELSTKLQGTIDEEQSWSDYEIMESDPEDEDVEQSGADMENGGNGINGRGQSETEMEIVEEKEETETSKRNRKKKTKHKYQKSKSAILQSFIFGKT